MASLPACQAFIPMLSPFIDGELAPAERVSVERHLAACQECGMRVADLRAESGLLRLGMEMLAEEADFRDFARQVTARLTPEKPPLSERLRLSLSEVFLYHRRMMVTALASAALVLLLALPWLLRAGTPTGYANPRLELQAVTVDPAAHLAPVVLETESGNTIIWMVEHDHEKRADEARDEELDLEPGAESTDLNQQAPQGGEL